MVPENRTLDLGWVRYATFTEIQWTEGYCAKNYIIVSILMGDGFRIIRRVPDRAWRDAMFDAMVTMNTAREAR